MKRVALTAGAAALALAVLTSSLPAGPPGNAAGAATAAGEEKGMDPSTSEQELRQQVSIAGQPIAVLWAAERLGPINPDAFPPGPSDHVLRAVLTYGSADEVASVVGDGATEEVEIEAPVWFPEALRPGSTLSALRHYDAEGFMDATTFTVPDAPEIVILERRSS